MKPESNLGRFLRQKSLIPVLLLVGEVVVFEALAPSFLGPANLRSIGDQLALLLPLALAGTFIIMMGSFDLSITSILALSGVTAALLYPTYGFSAMGLGLLVGVALGLINGLVFITANIPSFIVTIGTMVTYQGIALILLKGGQSVQIYSAAFRSVAIGKVGGVDMMILWSLLLFVVSYYIMSRTVFGRHTYAIGANIEAARRAGVDLRVHRVLSFMISGFLSAAAGVLYVAYSSQASAGIGSNLLLPAVAAMVIGGNPITGGIGGVHRTLLGAVILSTLSEGLVVLSVPINLQTIIYGFVVIVTIAATLDRERVRFIR